MPRKATTISVVAGIMLALTLPTASSSAAVQQTHCGEWKNGMRACMHFSPGRITVTGEGPGTYVTLYRLDGGPHDSCTWPTSGGQPCRAQKNRAEFGDLSAGQYMSDFHDYNTDTTASSPIVAFPG